MMTDAKDRLLSLLDPGSTVHVVIRSISHSGMSRTMDFFVIRDNELVYLSGYLSTLLKMRRATNNALRVTGCGMDMAFAVVSDLSRVLFNDPYALKHEVI